MSKEAIIGVLQNMDPLDDEQWTSNGDVKVEYVRKETGIDSIGRREIFEAAPTFSRANPKVAPMELKTEDDDDNAPEPVEGGVNLDIGGLDLDEDEDEDDLGEDDDKEEVSGFVAVTLESGLKLYRKTGMKPNSATSRLADMDEPMTEQEFAAFLQTVGSSELEELEKMLKDQQVEVSRQAEYLVDLKFRLKRALGFVQSRMKRELPQMSNQESIRAYIEAQNKQRAGRAAKAKAVQQQFGSLKDINPRSPLDQAMVRNTKRGAKRPTRDVLR